MLCAPLSVLAHTGQDLHFSFYSGFVHPVGGTDHLLVLLGVGFWAASHGKVSSRVIPGLFLVAMGLSAVFPVVGMGGMTEAVIAVSVVVTGLLLWFEGREPVVLGTLFVLVFGFFHGQAHVAEIPAGVTAEAYAAGFLVASALLQTLGVCLGRWDRLAFGQFLSVLCSGAGMIWLAAG
jgi:urease accessory protein